MSLTVLKRNLTRCKNDLVKIESDLTELYGVEVEDYTNEICASAKLRVASYKELLNKYETRRDNLECDRSETELQDINTTVGDELHSKLSLMVVQIEGRILSHEVTLEPERLEREAKLEQENREFEKYKIEKEIELATIQFNERARLEELNIRKLELEVGNGQSKVGSNPGFLPKIELIKFDGSKPERFSEFLECFSSIIDSRQDLTDSLKLQYLKMQLSGKAAKLLDGLKVTGSNYSVAKELLNEEYGSTQIVTNKLYNDISNLCLTSNRKEDVMKLYTDIEIKLRLLENLGNQVEGEVLASCIFKKLTQDTQRELVKLHSDNITVSHVRSRLKQELKEERVLRSLTLQCGTSSMKPPCKLEGFLPETRSKGYTAESLVVQTSGTYRSRYDPYCVFCERDAHFSDECPVYKSVVDRKKMLNNRCYVCLSRTHATHHCKNTSKCYHCGKVGAHYRALCPEMFPRGTSDCSSSGVKYNNPSLRSSDSGSRRVSFGDSFTQPNSKCKNGRSTAPSVSNNLNESQEDSPESPMYSNVCSDTVCNYSDNNRSVIYFQTATITVMNRDKSKRCEVRALFDSGSTHSYITNNLKTKLHIDDGGTTLSMNMFTFGSEVPKTVEVGKGFITVLNSQNTLKDIEVCIVPTIIHNHGRSPYDESFISSLRSKYVLADKYYCGKEEDKLDVDLLIGSDYYSSFIRGCPIEVAEGLYVLESAFGFILNGKYSSITGSSYNQCPSNFITYQLFTKAEMPVRDLCDVKQFWSLETLGIRDNCAISSDDLALQSFEKNLNYDCEEKRYYVSFPWINDSRDLKSNHGIAVGCLKSLLKVCEETFKDQISRGVLEQVEDGRVDTLCHYLPYHAVVRQESETTKVRFVMNASCKGGKNNHSLNDMLYRGPVLLENLGSLLLRFRLSKFGVVADIEKAFLNIGLNEEDRDSTRIVWLKDVDKEVTPDNIVTLRHARIPFGVVSSPFLLGAVISTHLAKYSGELPQKLSRDIYVDNIITGVNTEEELQTLVLTSREIFSEAKLNLRSWATSVKNSEFFNNLDPSITSQKEVQTVLGVSWDTGNDTLSVRLSFHYNNEPVTKRVLLSACSSFYDMLGMWSPIIIPLKVLIQKAWIENKTWDVRVSDQDAAKFMRILSDLEKCEKCPITRDVNLHTSGVRYELHAFADACISSYAAIVYLRCSDGNQTKVNIVFAKARVAPKERPTLPRLELLGALLAFRCLKYVESSLNLGHIDKCYLWCDNMSVLHWILGNKVLPTFVQNKVGTVDIKIPNGNMITRSVGSLYPLEFD
uniref:CCHC-type domain-containing protein n=1 Tax=Cacopsylla melanoneura TaxID=428564 RepID=A0A8D8RXR7_9HEMI